MSTDLVSSALEQHLRRRLPPHVDPEGGHAALAAELLAIVRSGDRGALVWGPGTSPPSLPPPAVVDRIGLVWFRDPDAGREVYRLAMADRCALPTSEEVPTSQPWPELLASRVLLTAHPAPAQAERDLLHSLVSTSLCEELAEAVDADEEPGLVELVEVMRRISGGDAPTIGRLMSEAEDTLPTIVRDRVLDAVHPAREFAQWLAAHHAVDHGGPDELAERYHRDDALRARGVLSDVEHAQRARLRDAQLARLPRHEQDQVHAARTGNPQLRR